MAGCKISRRRGGDGHQSEGADRSGGVFGAHRVMRKRSLRIYPGEILVEFLGPIDAAKYSFDERDALNDRVHDAMAAGCSRSTSSRLPRSYAGGECVVSFRVGTLFRQERPNAP